MLRLIKTVELREFVEFDPGVPTPVIFELKVTESQMIPFDLKGQSRVNFSW